MGSKKDHASAYLVLFAISLASLYKKGCRWSTFSSLFNPSYYSFLPAFHTVFHTLPNTPCNKKKEPTAMAIEQDTQDQVTVEHLATATIMTSTTQETHIEELKIAAKSNGLLDSILHPFHHENQPAWTNWAKNQSCDPAEIFNPSSLTDLTEIVLKAKANGKKIRCAASGHSWSSTSVTDGYLVVVNNMEKIHRPVWDDEVGSWTVTIETGVLVKDLDNVLRKNNPPLALPSNVVLDSVSILAVPFCCWCYCCCCMEVSRDSVDGG